MQKIEEFINRRFAEELEHIADGIDQPKPSPEWSDDYGPRLIIVPASSDPRITAERLRQTIEAIGAQVDRMKQREAEAIQLRERLLAAGGEEMVQAVDRYAAQHSIDWIDAARICLKIEAFNVWLASPTIRELLNQLKTAFADISTRIADGLNAAGIGDVFDQPPRNRHERRAKKHAARLEPDDPDQRWKNRDFRSRRNS